MNLSLITFVLSLSFSFLALSSSSSSSSSNPPDVPEFRALNRRVLGECPDLNPYVAIEVSSSSLLPDEGNVTVTVSGVAHPKKSDWIAMVSPSHAE